MPKLNLTKKERAVVAETLRTALSNLRYEIANTDNFDFRSGLKEKEAVLEKVVATLEQAS